MEAWGHLAEAPTAAAPVVLDSPGAEATVAAEEVAAGVVAVAQVAVALVEEAKEVVEPGEV
jgi:hypothetical protein